MFFGTRFVIGEEMGLSVSFFLIKSIQKMKKFESLGQPNLYSELVFELLREFRKELGDFKIYFVKKVLLDLKTFRPFYGGFISSTYAF